MKPARDAAGMACLTFAIVLTSPSMALVAGDGTAIEVTECVVRLASEINVPARETGLVAEVKVQANDSVEAGATIARLNDRTLLIERRSAQLRLDNAKVEAQDDVEIRYAEVALAEAQAELDNGRSIQNDARGAIATSQMRRLRLAVERGELEIAQAKKRLKRASVQAQLLEAELSAIDDQLSNLYCESPITGVVLEVARSAGEWITKGETIATIGRIDRLHVHALIDSHVIAPDRCRHLPVSVSWQDPTTGLEQSLRGKVLSVDPQTLPGGRFRLHAEIINEASSHDRTRWRLQPGADVRMKVYPSAAIARSPSQETR